MKVSSKFKSVKIIFPLFSTEIIKSILSPISLNPLEFKSFKTTVLVTSRLGNGVIIISVWSSIVFPSVSSPSSLVSVTSFV